MDQKRVETRTFIGGEFFISDEDRSRMRDALDKAHFVRATSVREAVLNEAAELTAGDRDKAYGDPVVNHQHIADIFNAVTGRDLSAREIVLVQQATKLARRAKNPLHRDSYVDGAAYTGIEYECALAENVDG